MNLQLSIWSKIYPHHFLLFSARWDLYFQNSTWIYNFIREAKSLSPRFSLLYLYKMSRIRFFGRDEDTERETACPRVQFTTYKSNNKNTFYKTLHGIWKLHIIYKNSLLIIFNKQWTRCLKPFMSYLQRTVTLTI